MLMSLDFTIAQFDGVKLEPGDTFSFINAYIINPNNSPYVGEVLFQGLKPYHTIKANTDKSGFVRVKVPVSDTYTLYCGRKEPAFRKSVVGDFPFITYEVNTFTHRFIMFRMSYMNESNQPLTGEKVEVKSAKNNIIYSDTIDSKGHVKFFIPYEDTLFVSVKYHDDLVTLTPTDVNKEYKIMDFNFKWMGSKEKERRAWVADSIARDNQIKMLARMDSLIKNGSIDDFLNSDNLLTLDYGDIDFIIQLFLKKAEYLKKQYASDPKFFENKNFNVLAVLLRLLKANKQQFIVTDVTCSMDGYMEQVLLWHALNFANGISTKYIFFNDGNGIANNLKVIGRTGGLHFVQGAIKDFKSVVESIRKAKSYGCSGDTEENDMEALLEAAKKINTYESLILVADNFSPMRDFSLIQQLKIPVKIILCGLESQSLWKEVNEEYLTLARKTGGSVHTLHEDVYNLNLISEGKTIIIEGVEYILENGKFRKNSKL